MRRDLTAFIIIFKDLGGIRCGAKILIFAALLSMIGQNA
jgi:hypothetical protein